jgi:hypothetical protein
MKGSSATRRVLTEIMGHFLSGMGPENGAPVPGLMVPRIAYSAAIRSQDSIRASSTLPRLRRFELEQPVGAASIERVGGESVNLSASRLYFFQISQGAGRSKIPLLFSCSSHRRDVVMDVFTRRLVGCGVERAPIDGGSVCRMFNHAIGGEPLPKRLST